MPTQMVVIETVGGAPRGTLVVDTAMEGVPVDLLTARKVARLTRSRSVSKFCTWFRLLPARSGSSSTAQPPGLGSPCSTFTFVEATFDDGSGHLIAHSTGMAVVRPMDPPPPSWRTPSRPPEEPRYPTPDPYLRPLPAMIAPIPRQDWERLEGIEIARRAATGVLPKFPGMGLLDVDFTAVEAGHIALTMPASAWFCLRTRTVSPGVLAAGATWALISAILTVSPGARRIGIVGLSLSFLRDLPANCSQICCDARVTERHDDLVVASVAVTSGGSRVAIGHETAQFLPLHRPAAPLSQPVLATIVFTDLAGSTTRAREVGDARWRAMLAEHDSAVRRRLVAYNGREVKTTGDGFLATFATPAEAMAFARAIRDDVAGLGLRARVGAHTGQCEVVAGDVIGLAVHLASRVVAAAAPGEILVTSTVRDLLLGADFKFEDRGRHPLRGIEGDWQLFALVE
jgi:class 3 adenylate cyclase